MLILVDVVANVDVNIVEQLAAAPEALPGCQDVTTQRQCSLATLCSTARRPQYAAHTNPYVLATLCSAERTGHNTQHTRIYTIALQYTTSAL